MAAPLSIEKLITLAKDNREIVWRALERLTGKGDADKLADLVERLPASIWSAKRSGSDEAARAEESARAAFWARAIKGGHLPVMEAIFNAQPDPGAARAETALKRFGSICEARRDEVNKFFFPEGEAVEFKAQHWHMALLSKNMELLERIAPQIDAKRALNFIESYFYDLQLAQVKRLSASIPEGGWPLRFARDAITRGKGPGLVSYYIDRGMAAERVNPAELNGALLAAVKKRNGKAFDTFIRDLRLRGMSFDWDKRLDIGDLNLVGEEALRVNAVKLPPELRRSTLMEVATLQAEMAICERLLDQGAAVPAPERMEQWTEFLGKTLRETGFKAADIDTALANARGCHDMLQMMKAAGPILAPTPEHAQRASEPQAEPAASAPAEPDPNQGSLFDAEPAPSAPAPRSRPKP